MLSRDPARSRPPTDRPLDVVGLELLLCVTQALLAGMLLTLTRELGSDARAVGLPMPGLLAVLGLAVGACWLWWLVGGSGWPLAAVDLAVALLTGALWLLSLQDPTAPRIDPLMGLIAVSCAVYGIVAGVFLPGPRRGHWKGGVSQPRRGLPDTRTTPARFSPPVQKVVDERLANVTLPRVTLAAVRLPGRSADASGQDLLLVAPATPPSVAGSAGTPGTTPVPPLSEADDADATEAVAPIDTDGPRPVPRIPAKEEPLSVAALRLTIPASDTPDIEAADTDGEYPGPAADDSDVTDDDDETVSYSGVDVGHPPTPDDGPPRA